MVRTPRPVPVAIALVLAVGASSPHAYAQGTAPSSADLATRRTHIEQARADTAAHRYAEALEHLEAAGRIRMDARLRREIAEAMQHAGRLGDALATADTCALEAGQGHDDHTMHVCERLADEMRDHVGYIAVHVEPEGIPGLHVTVAGREVPASVAAAPMIVELGAVSIDVTADGYTPEHRDVTAATGLTTSVDVTLTRPPVELPEVAPAYDAERAPPVVAGATATPVPPPSTRTVVIPLDGERAPVRRGPGAAPWVVVGVGGALVVTSVVLYALQASAVSECTVLSDSIACPTQAAADRAQGGHTLGIAGGVTLGVGLAGIAGGVLWFLLAPRTVRERAPVAFGANGVTVGF